MKKFLSILAIAVASTACCLVDEDLSNCPDDYAIDYEMRLITNVQTEINTVLGLDANIKVSAALRQYLKDIFSDFAHDVDLSFYDYNEPRPVLQHFSDIIDANQTSYTLHLPVHEYMHLAVANIADNHLVDLDSEQACGTSRLLQEFPSENNVIVSHNTGLFTARLPMRILEGVNQDFLVRLYMANCATALVIDYTGAPEISGFSAFTTGFADSFNIADSTYTFNRNPLVKADHVDVEDSIEDCYVTVQFPSKEPEPKPETKVVVETVDPFIAPNADEALWEWQVYITLPGGSVTLTRLGLVQPLRAGQLKIIRIHIGADGSAIPFDSSVAASVQLDWHQGSDYDIPL
ncbi:MAG: hypothetical protein J6W82_02825 [Bacteroidales bacterium]|nr:hypothetical protein [Bacteroidales bacterium]